MHALHGNGPRRQLDQGWQQAHRQSLDGRALQEPQLVAKLRAAGWSIDPQVPDDLVVRIYDTRLERTWLLGKLSELRLDAAEVVVVGGDFLLPPHREDHVALQSGKLTRWGPTTGDPYHVVVPPRPHVEVWMQRARQQLVVEGPGTWITMAVVVPRDRCPQVWDEAALRRVLPQAVGVLEDKNLEVRAVAVGERPPVMRVPADMHQLPPPRWDSGLLPSTKVLLFLSFRVKLGDRPPLTCRWLRDPPPPLQPEDLELLRLDYVLPPATKAATGERALKAALRRVSSLLGLAAPSGTQLRQMQVAQGVASALLGVPRLTACHWLRASGCGGLFIRPFWTPSTGAEVARSRFSLIWLRGHLAAGGRLWDALRDMTGFFGLVVEGKDLAVRVSAELDRRLLQSQVEFVLGSAVKLHSPAFGARWWRLGPLSESELWRVKDLIAQTGLQLVRADLRFARMGPFRSAVYFMATGSPSRSSLDDGSWTCSEARLTPAEPPPRNRPSTGPALSSQSTWGGPRSSMPLKTTSAAPSASAAPPQAAFPTPASLSTPTVWGCNQSLSAGAVETPPLAGPTPKAVAPRGSEIKAESSLRSKASQGRGRNRRDSKVASAAHGEDRDGVTESDRASGHNTPLVGQLAALTTQVGQLLQEIRELRRENAELRRQVEAARGIQQHQPYALTSLPPLPTPNFSPIRSAPMNKARMAGELTPESKDLPMDGACGGDVGMTSPSVDVESKRARRSLEVDLASTLPSLSSSSRQGPSPASLEAPLPHDE